MATAFGYVEREADSYVNWADVGRDMSNTIDDIQRVREEKKALIEKTYREDLKFIQDNPSGEHETLRAWSLGVAQSSAEMMRLQNTLLKQGKLNLPNYLSFRQNITDSVEKIYTVNSQLQEAFKEVNDRTKAGGNQLIERETKVLLEKYGKLEDTEAYINPLNGTIYLGLTEIVEEDGKSVKRLKKGEGTYLSPDQLQAAAIQKFDNFDPEPVMIKWVEGFGKVQDSIRSVGGEGFSGMITSIEDIKGDRWMQIAKENNLSEEQITQIKGFIDDFKKSEDLFIDGILQNEINASAILTELVGTVMIDGQPVPYDVVFDESEQTSDDKLYVQKTKEGQFTPRFDTKIGKKQKDVLREYLRSQLTPKYDRIVQQQPYAEQKKEKTVYQQPSEAGYARMGKQERASAYGSLLGKLYGLPYEDKEGTLTTIRNLTNGGSANFGVDENGDTFILMQNEKGNMRERIYYTKSGKPVPINTFVEQAATFLSGFEDVREFLPDLRNAAIRESNGGVLNTDFGTSQNRSDAAWTDKSTLIKEIMELEEQTWNPAAPLLIKQKQALLDKIEFRGQSQQQRKTQGGFGQYNKKDKK